MDGEIFDMDIEVREEVTNAEAKDEEQKEGHGAESGIGEGEDEHGRVLWLLLSTVGFFECGA